jgi:hypothetical protein
LTDASLGTLTSQQAKFKFVGPDGAIERAIGPDWVKLILDASKPGGIMLNNYRTGGSGANAYLPNGSWTYFTPDLKTGESFDVAPFGYSGVTYYVDRIFVRVNFLTAIPPNKIRASLQITGFDGRGPTLKGHCWEWYCLVGSDSSAPDITNLSITNGYFDLGLRVENGAIKAYVDDIQGTISFNCGGLSALICSDLRNAVNGINRQQLSALLNDSGRLNKLSETITNSLVPGFEKLGLQSLRSLTFRNDGWLVARGIPKP